MAKPLRLYPLLLALLMTTIAVRPLSEAFGQPLPHVIYGTVETNMGEPPPAEQLEFCVTIRPGEPTELTLCYPDSTLFGWDYEESSGFWRCECAEFNFWNVGDSVTVLFQIPGAIGRASANLNDAPAQSLGMTLISFLPIIDAECLPTQTDEDEVLQHDLIPCALDVEDPSEQLLWSVINWEDSLWQSVEIAGGQLAMIPLPDVSGEDELLFVVEDSHGGSDSSLVTLLINPINDPPQFFLPDTISFPEDSTLVSDFTQFCDDPDHPHEELLLFSGGGTEVGVEINGLEVTFSAPADWHGSELINFVLSDNEFFIEDSVEVAVISDNDHPWVEDVQIGPADPSIDDPLVASYSYFDSEDDPESGSLYHWFRDGEQVTDLNGLLEVPAEFTDYLENWYFVVTPSDGEDYGDPVQSNELIINNSPPVLEGIPDQELAEDGQLQLDLAPYLTDAEQPDSIIAVTLLNDPDPVHLGLQLDQLLLQLTALVENYNDLIPLELVLQADDLFGGIDTDTLLVTIVPVNDPPAIDVECLPAGTSEDIELVQDLTTCATDIEDASAELEWEIADWDPALWETVTLEGASLTMRPLPDVSGGDEVTFTVTDLGEAGGDRLSDSVLVNISIFPLNDAPLIELPDSLGFAEDSTLQIDFSQFLSDIDSDSSLLLTVSGNQQIAVEIDSFNVLFSAPADWYGSEELTFTIDDQDLRLTDSDQVMVVVEPVNDLPLIDPGCLQLSVAEDDTLRFDLTGCAADVEDDTTELIWSLLPEGEADWDPTLWESFSIEDNLLTAVPLSDVWGADSVTFRVTDLEPGTTSIVAVVEINCGLDYGGRTDFVTDRGSLLIINLAIEQDCGTPLVTGMLPDWLELLGDEDDRYLQGRPTVEESPQLFTLEFALNSDTLAVDFSVELMGTLITTPGTHQVELPTEDDGYLRFLFDAVEPPYYLVITEVDLPERSNAEGLFPAAWQVETDLPADTESEVELYLPERLPQFMELNEFAPTHLYFYSRLGAADSWERQADTEVLDDGARLLLAIDRFESGEWSCGAWYQDVSENRLWQNYPNPFNDETRIGFDLVDNNSEVSVAIYNAVGDKVWQDRGIFNAGDYLQNYFIWNGSNQWGEPVGSGVYIIRVKIAGRVYTKQTVFMRRS